MNKRFYLIDILRLPILYSIVWFHSYSFLFSQEYNPEQWAGTFSEILLFGMRLFTYGGQWIFSISCFLLGYRELRKKQTLTYLFLFFVGCLVLTVGQSDQFPQNFVFEWDIYHFLFLNLTFIYFLQRKSISGKCLTLLGGTILMIPFWKFDFLFTNHSLLKKILIGDFTGSGEGGWALLPWSGLTFLFYGLGQLNRESKLNWSNSLSTKGLLSLCGLALLSSTSLIYFYPTPLGPEYYVYIFQPPLWALIGVNGLMIIALRLAIVTKWNERLAGHKWIQRVSKLNWNQNLAMTYLVQLIFLFCVLWSFELGLAGIDLIAILGFFIAEIFISLINKLSQGRSIRSLPLD